MTVHLSTAEGATTGPELLVRRALNNPTDPALSGGSFEALTFAELHEESIRLAEQLMHRYPRSSRIALCASNRPDMVVLQYATAFAGMVLVPVNPSSSVDELAHILDDASPVLVVTARTDRGRDMHKLVEEACAVAAVHVDQLLFDSMAELASDHARMVTFPTVGPDDLAQIQYTSGSTGRPKGVRIGHGAMLSTAVSFARAMGVDTAPWLNPNPLFHTAGNVIGVLGPLCRGSECIVIPFSVQKVFDLIESRSVGVLGAAPTLLHDLVREAELTPGRTRSLARIYTGGATFEPHFVGRVEKAFDALLLVTYGLTETMGVVSTTTSDDSFDVRSTTCGRPIKGAELRISDVGEIWLRGPRITDGYTNSDRIGEALDPDGWLHTGDLGTVDSAGHLRITGRMKDMIKTGGENVSPAEVEACLLEHDSILQAAVIGIPDERWGELVTAFVRVRDRTAVQLEDLDAFCRARLSSPKVPRRWAVVDHLPSTATGKLNKKELRAEAARMSADLMSLG